MQCLKKEKEKTGSVSTATRSRCAHKNNENIQDFTSAARVMKILISAVYSMQATTLSCRCSPTTSAPASEPIKFVSGTATIQFRCAPHMSELTLITFQVKKKTSPSITCRIKKTNQNPHLYPFKDEQVYSGMSHQLVKNVSINCTATSYYPKEHGRPSKLTTQVCTLLHPVQLQHISG